MPGVQNSALQNQINQLNIQREDLATGPLGSIGNLRFKPEEGASPRASGPGLLARIGNFFSDLAFYVTAGPEQRAQRYLMNQARENSQHIGDLLGRLTTTASDANTTGKIARELASLSEKIGGNLDAAPGARLALQTYLSELTSADLQALHSGPLAKPETRAAIIEKISPPTTRAMAAVVLEELAQAANLQLAKDSYQGAVNDLLAQARQFPLDTPALQQALEKLATGSAMTGRELLDTYIKTLPDTDLNTLHRLVARQPAVSLQAVPDDFGTHFVSLVKKSTAERIEQNFPQLGARIDQAAQSGNTEKLSAALLQTSFELERLNNAFDPLPGAITNRLRSATSLAMINLRDIHDDQDGLSRTSLGKLSDNALSALYRSYDSLQPYGLNISRSEARAEIFARANHLNEKARSGCVELLKVIGATPLNTDQMLRHLSDQGKIQFARNQFMADMGYPSREGMGTDDAKRLARIHLDAAVQTLRDSGQGALVDTAMSRLPMLNALTQSIGSIHINLGDNLENADLQETTVPAMRIMSSNAHLLDSLRNCLEAQQIAINPDWERTHGELPTGLANAVLEQYGQIFDPQSQTSRPLLTDRHMEVFGRQLTQAPSLAGHPEKQATLTVGGQEQSFGVSRVFFADGIERPSIKLSVRGADTNGNPVRSNWPQNTPDENSRLAAMGDSLLAMREVCGPAMLPLTRVMNQQLVGGIMQSLMELGADSPVKLPDGRAVFPGGGGNIEFDLRQNPDGSFALRANVSFNLDTAVVVDANGVAQPLDLDVRQSWMNIQLEFNASPDGASLSLANPPHFSHHFEMNPQVVQNAQDQQDA